EVAIGLILVYYLLGSLVSTLTRVITESLQTRGIALRMHLEKLAGTKAKELFDLPQIKALRPIRYKNWFSVFSSTTEAKLVERIPSSLLVDAFFDLTKLTEKLTAKKDLSADELLALIGELPESDGKQAILTWIKQGVTDINDIRKRTNDYFCGILDQAAATFKANARTFVLILSIAIVLLFGTDSIQLAKDLWANAELRAIAAAQAGAVIQQGGTPDDLTSLLDDLSRLTIRIGWWQTQALPTTGLVGDWASFIFLKILGLGLSVMAVAQGSSFWYDLLRRITGRTEQPKSQSEEAKG
ncbi:MAG: hypothetical protein AB1649_34935, partial [Chloroflexota bacterium]